MERVQKMTTQKFSIGFFERDANDQKDAYYFPFLKQLLNNDIDIFPKPVCFGSRKDQKKHKKTPTDGVEGIQTISKTCACLSSFLFQCNKHQTRPQAALIEGKIGRIVIKKGKRTEISVSSDLWEYHSCIVFVDKERKTVLMQNPWRERTARTRSVMRIADLRPHLFHKVAKNFGSYDIYYKAGAQVGSSDCRVQLLRFAKAFGQTNIQTLLSNPLAFGWKLLSRGAKP
jgi:hypothetical protein